ncbi:MAG TPA: hypothetical protein VHJ34_09615 [Actinomycetota bacterium]|nr:hypothetical protein [Actinomycetota bacterium]
MTDDRVLSDDDITTTWLRGAGAGAALHADRDSADPDGTDADGTDSDSDSTDSDSDARDA